MKRRHIHSWRIVGHPFGAVVKYECSSCPETYAEKRRTSAEKIRAMEDALGIPSTERMSNRLEEEK